jgi:6-pyruvoyl-tetrahydropterin synthase
MHGVVFVQLPSGHRVVILSSMERIIRQTIEEIDQELALDIIKQSSAELTHSKVLFIYIFKLVKANIDLWELT